MFKLCMKMSDKTFERLSKYYTLAKKYLPLILLGIVFILALCKLSATIYISVYVCGIVLHLLSMALIQKALKVRMSAMISAEELKKIDEMIEGDVQDEDENDTKESN